MELRKFQQRFVRAALHRSCLTAALSLPRGNGKSALGGHLLTRCLTPGDPLNVPGSEYLLCAASIEQARLCFRFVRAELEPTGLYRFLDSATRIGITGPDNTRLRILSSNGKTAMGIVGCPLLIADEPGSWEVVGGELMHDAIATAQGKPGSRLRVIYIGTLAPARSGWWPDLVADGSHGSTRVQVLQGDPAKWDRWPEIRRCNPLTAISADFRAKLLEERDDARRDARLKARFLSYRLNVPTTSDDSVLLTVESWHQVKARPAPDGEGQPIVAIDMGGGRAWSAAVALWRNGRTEARAIAPGVPSIEAQERRDRVSRGTYQRLVDAGTLTVAEGRRVPPAVMLVDLALAWSPEVLVCDRFRLPELQDSVDGRVRLVPRVSRWSEASADIRALRAYAADGPLSVTPAARGLVEASLSVATVRSDDQGSVRLIKRSTNNTARDDVAAAWVLAAGMLSRAPAAAPSESFVVC